MIPIPFFKQDTNYTCGPTSLQMVFAFFGERKSEAALAHLAHTKKKSGTSHENMVKIVKKEGFHYCASGGMSIDDIAYFLSQKLPVIVDYTEPSTNDGHYAVVTAIKEGAIILNDPWNGKGFSISIDEFKRRWKDDITNSKRWALVISKDVFESCMCNGKK